MYPSVDMHGLDRESARVLTDDFVKENIKLGNKKIIIIHGKGSHIVKQSVHQELNKNQYVEDYKLSVMPIIKAFDGMLVNYNYEGNSKNTSGKK